VNRNGFLLPTLFVIRMYLSVDALLILLLWQIVAPFIPTWSG
jgi:hypothetical protein